MRTAHLPPPVARWAPQIQDAADAYRVPPYFLAAIMHVESGGGTLLHPPGPEGCGDFTPRNPAHWEMAMPPDGLGWGRGLMQIDWFSNRAWCEQKDAATGKFVWQIPEQNIRKGAEKIRAAYEHFSGDLELTALSYNAGIAGAAHAQIQASAVDPSKRRAILDGRSAPPHRYVTAVMTRLQTFTPEGT